MHAVIDYGGLKRDRADAKQSALSFRDVRTKTRVPCCATDDLQTDG